MHLLDSDVVRLYLSDKGQQPHLVRRINAVSPNDIWISVITIEESVQGAMRLINCNQKDNKFVQKQMLGYSILADLVPDYSSFQILPFDEKAFEIYQGMSAQAKRKGANDCKIAAIALSKSFTVITRNTKDYAGIGVPHQDWTRE